MCVRVRVRVRACVRAYVRVCVCVYHGGYQEGNVDAHADHILCVCVCKRVCVCARACVIAQGADLRRRGAARARTHTHTHTWAAAGHTQRPASSATRCSRPSRVSATRIVYNKI